MIVIEFKITKTCEEEATIDDDLKTSPSIMKARQNTVQTTSVTLLTQVLT